MFETIILIGLLIMALLALVNSVKIIQQYERGIVLRLGRYHSLAEPGVTLLIPFIDTMRRVDMREQVINVMPQSVITEDNVVVTVDAVIYYKIVDPVKAEFEIENFQIAATTLAQTNLRNIIGETQLDETLTARDRINTTLRGILDEATNAWGVKVTKVELQKIEPPTEIINAMSKQMKAEREKRADILQAQGFREAEILRAEGAAQSELLRAEAEAKAVKMVAEAAEQHFTDRAIKLKQLEVAGQVLGGDNTKFVLPTSGELVNVLNLDGENPIVPVKQDR